MKQPVDQIAEKLIGGAYKLFGNPGEEPGGDPGGDYIAKVTAETDVPAYFRHVANLAAAPRSMDIYERHREHDCAHPDADFVMNAGLDFLLTDATLSAEQRRVIEQIKALAEETRKAEEAIRMDDAAAT
jgi:hypothetical protein